MEKNRVRVETSARLHFGFVNLSLARKRLYGGLGVALDRPRVEIEAETSEVLEVEAYEEVPTETRDKTKEYAERALSILNLDSGVKIQIEESIPRHVGLGSGTQLALATLAAVAYAHTTEPCPGQKAPEMGRGGRSGVGVGVFESGGFVVDAGHPSESFTSDAPERGDWDTPPVVSRHDVPEDWRFVVGVPDSEGISGEEEDTSIREVISRADPSISSEISDVIVDTVLPGIATRDIDEFGAGIERVGRLNGAWYTEFQGGVYREESRSLIKRFRDHDVAGAGQSSWGPASYALVEKEKSEEVADSVRELAADVFVAEPRNEGYRHRQINRSS